jgi:glycine cleavage system aminomethyltransferase T
MWLKRMAEDNGWNVYIDDRSDHMACLGVWGPNARKLINAIADDPAAWEDENFPFAATRRLTLQGIPVEAFRISYVGEQGWELHVDFSYGLSLWDLVYAQGATPVGIETYANSRRMEKSLRLQNADLLTEYNLYEAGLARPVVKQADFHGKAPYLEQRELKQQAAYLCTLVMNDNVDSNGIARYPVGNAPLIDPETGEVPIDSKGRRSYLSSIAFGPSIGKNIGLGYLPHEYCQEGREMIMEYLGEQFTMQVAAVGYKPLYDPENKLPRS